MSEPAAPRAANPATITWLALVLIGLAWGSTQYFSKLVVTDGHHPLGISVASTFLGACLITAVLLLRGVALPLSRRHLVFYAICGLTGTALPNFVHYTAIRELPVGVISIITAAVPMMTFVGALMFGIDRPEPRRIVGLVAGAVAVLILVVPEASLPEPEDAFWVGFALITGISYTVENIYIAKAQPPGTTALQTLCGLSWMAMLLVLPLVGVTDTWMALGDLDTAEAALVAMTVAHLIAYGGFVWLIARAGPVFAAQVGYIVTLTGVFLGIVLLGESHSAWVWLSLVIMMGGLALVQPRDG